MCSAVLARPTIDGDRAYYVSNRGELVCVAVASGQVVWTLDMPTKLAIMKRDWGDIVNPVPGTAVVDDIVFAVTGNGSNYGRLSPTLSAPSLVAADKRSGKVLWTFAVPATDLRF